MNDIQSDSSMDSEHRPPRAPVRTPEQRNAEKQINRTSGLPTILIALVVIIIIALLALVLIPLL